MRRTIISSLAISFLIASTTASPLATPLVRFQGFASASQSNGIPIGWTVWSPRAETAPSFAVDVKAGRSKAGALKIESRGKASFGAWRRRVNGIEGGKTYRFTAWYRAEKVAHERRSIIARLEWLDEKGNSVRSPDYAIDVSCEGPWTKVQDIVPTPDNARTLDLQLSLAFSENGRVWWDDIQLTEEPAPPQRLVRAMTVFCRPSGTGSREQSVEQFCRLVESAAQKPDIVCLPEGITVVGTGKTYPEVSESLPGPTTARLGALAKKLHCYVVAGLYERSGKIVYNTAVLVGRDGQLAGSYRKTHLPREEWEAGITPGDSYPIFQTDFGKVGLMICWDLQFPEPCRALALKGAEVILLPIWGGNEVLARARAIENHIFLVTSSYDMRTFIVDPAGKVLAEATHDKPIASAELPLDQKIFQPWLGDMKNRTWKERRPDIPIE